MTFDSWDRWERRHVRNSAFSSITDAFPSCLERTATQPFLTLTLPRLHAQTILLLQNCPPVKHAPLLVGCRQTPALVFKLNSPTQLLAHIAKKSRLSQIPGTSLGYFDLTKNYYCCVGCFIEPTLVRTFSIFPLWDLAFVHKHTTLKSFTLPHTSTTVIQTAERWERLRINCSCMKSFINNVYCCFLLLPTAVRG